MAIRSKLSAQGKPRRQALQRAHAALVDEAYLATHCPHLAGGSYPKLTALMRAAMATLLSAPDVKRVTYKGKTYRLEATSLARVLVTDPATGRVLLSFPMRRTDDIT
jgi:hypothetical protein